jgi:hypothetical protein
MAEVVSSPRKKKDKPRDPEVIVDGKRATKDGRRLSVRALAENRRHYAYQSPLLVVLL